MWDSAIRMTDSPRLRQQMLQYLALAKVQESTRRELLALFQTPSGSETENSLAAVS